MAIETLEEVRARVFAMPKPKCPACGQEMSIYEVPPINFSDGLGWGEPYLFVCFNDECPLYQSGWEHIQENYAHTASYRQMCYPSSGVFEVMTVFGHDGGKGQIMDDVARRAEEALKENIKRGFNLLAQAYVDKDGVVVLRLLMDPTEPVRVRIKAAEMIGDIGELEAIEPVRNLRVGNEKLQEAIDSAVQHIHDRFFTRECPYCAEIIKRRAKVCKHCGREVAGA
jgi:hypothetical protein